MNDSKNFSVNITYPNGQMINQPAMDAVELAIYFAIILNDKNGEDDKVVRVWGVEENSYIASFIRENGKWRFDASNRFPAKFFSRKSA